jgi:hypothetical protein
MKDQAILPDYLEETGNEESGNYDGLIRDMTEGQMGYTPPWAMWADEDGLLWLNGNYPCVPEPSGTSEMRVIKQNDGTCIVDIINCRGERWSKECNYFTEANMIPVSKLLGCS